MVINIFDKRFLRFSNAAKKIKAGPIVMQINANDGGYFVTFNIANIEYVNEFCFVQGCKSPYRLLILKTANKTINKIPAPYNIFILFLLLKVGR